MTPQVYAWVEANMNGLKIIGFNGFIGTEQSFIACALRASEGHAETERRVKRLGRKDGDRAALSDGHPDIFGRCGISEGLRLRSVAAFEKVSDVPVAGAGHGHVTPGSDFE